MTFKLSSLALLTAITTAATAQTTPTPKTTTTTAAHHTTTAQSTTPPNIPKVVGIPKTLYALKYIDTKIGTGPLAEPSILGTSQADSKIKWYTVHYTGWLTDGTKFDSSFDHPGGEPLTFPSGVHRVIIGWDTGFQGMHIGGKRRLFIPYQLAYGDASKPPIPAKANLIFDIELVAVSDKPPVPKQPAAAPQQKPATEPAQPSTNTTPPADKPATPPQPQTPPHPETF
jgi:peptidylprolyl isomerase